MQYLWILLVLLYGVSKGVRDTMKKLALNKSSLIEVLFFHALLAFVLVIPFSKGIFDIPAIFYFLIFLKSLFVFFAWIFSYKSICKMPISSYGLIDVSGVIFSTLMGVFILREQLDYANIFGIFLVILGLYFVNFSKMSNNESQPKYILLALVGCLLNAASGTLDKIYTRYVTPGQLQFWFMLYMVILYFIYILFTKQKVSIISAVKNHWIILMSVIFVVSDRILFIANSDPGSKVAVMTLLKQSCVIVSIFLGKFVFQEKNILYKLLCSLLIITGIVFSVS
jgi:drug/metabolite transporter (DMT)-like permease